MRWIVVVAVSLAAAWAWQETALTRRPFAGGTIDVPAGWAIETRSEGGNWTLEARRNPDDGAAPALTVYLMPAQAGQTATGIVEGMVQGQSGTRVTGRETTPEGEVFPFTFPLEATGGGQGAFLVQVRPAQKATLVLALTASRAEFARAGGAGLLRRVAATVRGPGATIVLPLTRGSSPPPGAGGSAAPAGEFLRLPEIVAKTAGFAAAELPGLWGEGQGSVITQIQQRRISDTALEEISRTTGTQGRARVIRFLPNQRYQWLTTTEVSDTGCLSRGSITETGTYQFDGATLTVRPEQYDGWIFVCSPADRERQRGASAPPRRYQVFTAVIRQALGTGGGGTRRALYLVGPCGKHLTDCDYDNQVEIILQRL